MEMELCLALTLEGLDRDFEVVTEYEEIDEYETVGTISPAGYGSMDISAGTRKSFLELLSAKEIDENADEVEITYDENPALWDRLEEAAAETLREMN